MIRRLGALSAALIAIAALLSACTGPDRTIVAFLLPSDQAFRWESVDRQRFQEAVEQRCTECEVLIFNANNDPDTQRRQFTDVVEEGADVVVLAAVDAETGGALVGQAEIPVVAYDRFLPGADYYVGFDTEAVGTMQAQALLAASGPRPRILMVNGAAGDPNTAALKSTVQPLLTGARARVLATLDPPDWSAETARDWVRAELRKFPRVDAVYAANDAQADGVVQAFQEAKRKVPILTGQDGELTAMHRIISGTQTMTAYKSVPDLARQAGLIAVSLIGKQPIADAKDVDGVPSFVYEPVPVTLATLTNTVVRDGVLSIDQLCPANISARCTELGIR